jgi:PAS domain S-box-containing protein
MPTHASQPSVAALVNRLRTDAKDGVRRGGASLDVLRRLLEALPVAAFVADDDGRYILTNALASELTGYSAEELRRLSVWQLTPGVNEHDAETLWRAFRQQGAQTGDYELLTKNGQVVRAKYAARANVLPRMHVSLLDGRSHTTVE